MIPRLALDKLTQPEPLGALAALRGEHGQLLVEAVRNLFLEFVDMALLRVKLGRLHRHAVGLFGFFIGPHSGVPHPITPLSQSKSKRFFLLHS